MGRRENSGSGQMKVSYELDKWLTSITIHEDTSQQDERSQKKPKIQKVNHMLRNIKANEKCYEPLVVSLGPFHHGRTDLDQMEKLKLTMAHHFVKDSKMHINEMYNMVATVVVEAKEYYHDEVVNGLSDLDFTKMMFLDGCFILQFIFMITLEQTKTKSVMKSNDVAFVYRDLFLLENQVPFVVLDVLMSLRFTDAQKGNMFMKLFQGTQALPPGTTRYLNELMGKIKSMMINVPIATTALQDSDDKSDECQSSKSIHLLDLARTQLLGERKLDEGQKTASSEWLSYRSAKELKSVGIHFRPSKTQSFTDVRFQSNLLSGTLWLPPLTVDDSTKSKLLNMVAYETCPDAPDDFAIASYICLMDALIDQAEDVMVLRSKGIILNLLGSDQQVADLFNDIGNDLVPNPNAYSLVKEQIENHYKNKVNIWAAQWLHTHFHSPWTVVGLLAAVFVIGLTVIQTYFTVFPRDKKP